MIDDDLTAVPLVELQRRIEVATTSERDLLIAGSVEDAVEAGIERLRLITELDRRS